MSAWRTGGIGPEKTGAGLRGIGLIAIVFAFLVATNQYVSNDDKPKETGPRVAGKPTVVAAEELRPLLPRLSADAVYLFSSPAQARTRIEDNEQADVFLTTIPSDAIALEADNRCTDAITIATLRGQKVVACLPTNVDADSKLGVAYLKSITTLEARAKILDAGFDVPEG
ncbi:MAG: hypothetical protein Q7T55_21405 [Solirubrobacteraceae bacterium]|nr:hypothetical protein [Solirubrobacteraceae bacterium]